MSGTFIGQLESGTRRMHLEYARHFDETLGTEDFFTRNCGALAKSKYPDHFAEAAEAEAVAVSIRQYAPLLIPGLLQTRGYAHAVFRAYQPTATEGDIEGLVADRLERARLLDDPTTPLLWTVLDEAVLRRKVGGAAVMAEALLHVATLAQSCRIIVQVLPFAAGAHMSLGGTLKLMKFADAPPLAFVDGLGIGRLEDDPATVARHELTYASVGASALSPQESLALIQSVAEDYAHEDYP